MLHKSVLKVLMTVSSILAFSASPANARHGGGGASEGGGGSNRGSERSPSELKPSRSEPAKSEPARQQPTRQEPAKSEPARQQPTRQEPAKSEPARQQPTRQEPAKSEPARQQPTRTETPKESNRVVLNPTRGQGGIGNMKGQSINNVQPVAGRKDVMRGTNDRGQTVTFKQKADGTHQVTAVQGKTSSGHAYQARYDESGRKKSMQVTKTDGSIVKSSFHKDGSSRSEIKKPDGSRIVTDSKRGGYVQSSPRTVGGQTIVQRTYVNKTTVNVSNRVVVRNYYVGQTGYYGYAPSYSFWPGYYVYYRSPWTPFYYTYNSWGWYSNPWLFNPYNPYAYYFTPYPSYYGASYWIVDNILADLLAYHHENEELEQRRALDYQTSQATSQLASQSAQTQQQATQIAAQQAVVNRQEKDIMANQVNQETTAQQSGTSFPLETALAKGGYRFYIGEETIDASYLTRTGETAECSMDSGDIMTSSQPVLASMNAATGKLELPLSVDMTVVTSKKGDCPATAVVTVATESLVNLKNDFAAKVNEKQVVLTQQGGKNGIPAAPAGGQITSNVQLDAQSKAQAEKLLDQHQQEINQIQQEVQ
jgi:uncharacterized membrane-anchored protein